MPRVSGFRIRSNGRGKPTGARLGPAEGWQARVAGVVVQSLVPATLLPVVAVAARPVVAVFASADVLFTENGVFAYLEQFQRFFRCLLLSEPISYRP